MNTIELKGVGKAYPGERTSAVKNISFCVAQSEFLCIIGPSGCGKTTVLKLIAGLEAPTVGELIKPKKVSMTFQAGALFPWLTVFENAALGLRQRHAPESEVSLAVERELRAL